MKYKFSVARMMKEVLVGHIPKRNPWRFLESIFYFLRSCYIIRCFVKVTAKAINQGNGMEMKVQCKLFFWAEEKFTIPLKFHHCKLALPDVVLKLTLNRFLHQSSQLLEAWKFSKLISFGNSKLSAMTN